MTNIQPVSIKCPECDEELPVDVTMDVGKVDGGVLLITISPNLAYAILHMFCHEVTT